MMSLIDSDCEELTVGGQVEVLKQGPRDSLAQVATVNLEREEHDTLWKMLVQPQTCHSLVSTYSPCAHMPVKSADELAFFLRRPRNSRIELVSAFILRLLIHVRIVRGNLRVQEWVVLLVFLELGR